MKMRKVHTEAMRESIMVSIDFLLFIAERILFTCTRANVIYKINNKKFNFWHIQRTTNLQSMFFYMQCINEPFDFLVLTHIKLQQTIKKVKLHDYIFWHGQQFPALVLKLNSLHMLQSSQWMLTVGRRLLTVLSFKSMPPKVDRCDTSAPSVACAWEITESICSSLCLSIKLIQWKEKISIETSS